MTEQEIKKTLTLNQYQKIYKRLLKLAFFQNQYVQVNHYFDSPDFAIHRSSETLRVRQKGELLTLEYKRGKKIHNGTHVCSEYSVPLSDVPDEIILNHCFPEIADTNKYYLIGSLTTERSNFIYDRMTISLDKNHYLGKADCEIEIEFDRSDPSQLITALQLDGYGGSLSKYERFINRYSKKERKT